MMQVIHRSGRGGLGPRSLDTRYVLEDCPYGLAMTVRLGEMTGRPARLHDAGVRLFSALYGVDLARRNDLLPAIGMDEMTLDELKRRATEGYLSPSDPLDA
jgi:opine dehydrogenase